MASTDTLLLARKLLAALNAYQSQGSLTSQARDVWPLLEALGYYDIADYLKDTFPTTTLSEYE